MRKDNTSSTNRPVSRKLSLAGLALRTAILYALLGVFWVFATDRLLAFLVKDPATLAAWQTYKGWLYVAVSTAFIYWLLSRAEQAAGATQGALQENETQLRETEEQHRLMVEQSPSAIGIYQNEVIVFANQAAARLFGAASPEALLGASLDRLVHPDEQAATRERVTRMLQGERGLYPVINRYQRVDGGEILVEVTSAPFVFQGRPAIQVIAVDISERVKAEETVKLQAAALEAAANGIVITGADGVIEWINAAFTALTGYTSAEAVGHDLRDLVYSGVQDRAFYRGLWETILSGQVWHGQLINRRKNGSLYTEEQTITPVPDATGAIRNFIAIKQDISARTAVEQALRESEERYRSLFENNHSVMLLIDPASGAIVDANPAAAAYYGWDIATLRSKFIGEINLLSAEDLRTRMSQAQSGEHNHFLFQDRLADGSLRDVEVFCGPILHDGRPLLYSIVHDITERMQNQREMQALVAVGNSLRMVQTHAEMLPVVLDELITLLSVDGAALEILDNESGALTIALGRGIWECTTGQVLPPGAGLSAQVLATAQPYLNNAIQAERLLFHPDLIGECQAVAGVPLMVRGEIMGLLWIASRRPLQTRDVGMMTSMANLAANAIHRAALDNQLQMQAEQMMQIIRSVPDGVLLLDPNGRILQINLVAENALQQLNNSSSNEPLVQLGDKAIANLLTSPPTGQWHVLQTGRQTFEVIARPVESGPVAAGWVLVIRNVTEALAFQQQLQRQERLAAIGQLAAGIAHDFNNLMSVIVLYAQMLEETPALSERERERVVIIEQQALRATSMIRQILDFSRRSVLERQQLDLLPILKEQIKLLQRTLPENIEVIFTYAAEECLVKADPTRIEQMLVNLAVNARDAMPEGGSLTFAIDKVSYATAREAPLAGMNAGEWLRLAVSDTGHGIESDVLEHIFEPFFTTKEPGAGVGLGLAQVHGIVGQHNGAIGIESQPGAGATFTIYLPALALLTANASASPPLLALPHGHGEVILVVEDDGALRTSLTDILRLWEYEVRETPNGVEALALITAEPDAIDLIISDVVMPRLGGIALFYQLREAGIMTPMLLVSGHPLGGELEGLKALGLRDWLTKPVSSEALAKMIAAVFANSTR